jgi:hypothetical protein
MLGSEGGEGRVRTLDLVAARSSAFAMYRWTPSITRETTGSVNSSGDATVAQPSSIAASIGGASTSGSSTVNSSYTRSGRTKVTPFRRANRRTA